MPSKSGRRNGASRSSVCGEEEVEEEEKSARWRDDGWWMDGWVMARRERRRRNHHRSKHTEGGQRASEGSIDSRRATTDLEREQRVRARRRVRERGRHDARVGSRARRRLTEASSFGFVRVGFLLSSVRSVATCPKTG